MDTIEMRLCSPKHGDTEILLRADRQNDLLDIPSGKEVVYNDSEYTFCIPKSAGNPTKLYINDEKYDVENSVIDSDYLLFSIKDPNSTRSKKASFFPFFYAFGAVKIEVKIADQRYSSKSIAVMVKDWNENSNVMNMIEYIYEHCEKHLYEECNHGYLPTGDMNKEIISLESKIAFVKKTLEIYRNSYQYLKCSPYSKLQQTQSVESFDKLQSVSQSTIRYISSHIDELVPVNYNTGIRYNNQYYQPKNVLVERNVNSYDVYENQIILGFLRTVTADIRQIIKELDERTYNKSEHTVKSGYVDSMYQIFSRSIIKVNGYLDTLRSLEKEYQQLYYFYVKLFGIQPASVRSLPTFTQVFRSVYAYRQIYQLIHEWFSVGIYNLGRDDLLLNFVSTTKIYEYYCLIKLLNSLNERNDVRLTESRHYRYGWNNKHNIDSGYNNTFVYEGTEKRVTLYFQPVIFKDERAENGIQMYRNTSSGAKSSSRGGKTYTPDYILKVEEQKRTKYIILDAKYTPPENVWSQHLQEMVYKYLFSLSPLRKEDEIAGLYIISGRPSEIENAENDFAVRDYANRIHRTVHPFAEICIMNGKDTGDSSTPSMILGNI